MTGKLLFPEDIDLVKESHFLKGRRDNIIDRNIRMEQEQIFDHITHLTFFNANK